MQQRSIQIIVACALGAALIIVMIALLAPRRPRIISQRPAAGLADGGSSQSQGRAGGKTTRAGDEADSYAQAGSGANQATPAPGAPTPAPTGLPVITAPGSGGSTTMTIALNPGATPIPGPVSGGPGTGADSPGGFLLRDGAGAPGAGGGKTSPSSDDGSVQNPFEGISESAATPLPPDATPDPDMALVGGQVMMGDVQVKGARLSLTGQGRALIAYTTEEGLYQFPPVDPGVYRLMLESPKAPSSVRFLTLKAGDSLTNEDFIIPLGLEVRGYVLNDTTSAGVYQARVIFNNSSERYLFELHTDAAGYFETAPLEAGSYVIIVEAAGYQTRKTTALVPEDLSEALPEIEIRLTPGATLRGRITTPDGLPLYRATVGLFAAEGASGYNDPFAALAPTQTNSSGYYDIRNVPSLEIAFQIGAWKAGYAPAYGPVLQLPAAASGELAPLAIGPGAIARGKVIDTKSKPIPGAIITIPSPDWFRSTGAILQRFNAPTPQTETDASGQFTLPGIEAGAAMRIIATATGYQPKEVDFTAQASGNDLGEITLLGEDELGPDVIYGQIVDDRGAIYPRANCTLYCVSCSPPVSLFQTTDELGYFYFRNLTDATYRLSISTSSLRDAGVWIVLTQRLGGLKPGTGLTLVDFDMSGKTRLRVEDIAGRPLRKFRVSVKSETDPAAASDSTMAYMSAAYEWPFESATGEALIEHLIPGYAEITVTVDGVGVAKLSGVRIPYGETGDAGVVVVGEGGKISGRVTSSATGGGLAGARVYAIPPEGAASDHILYQMNLSATADSAGQFTLSPLPSGALRLRATATGHVEKVFPGFEAVEGRTVNAGDLALAPGATLYGVVRDAAGATVAGALVRVGLTSASSDSQGRYRLEGVATGPQELQFSRPPEVKYQTLAINLSPGEIRAQDLQFP